MRKYYFEDDLILRTSTGGTSLSHMFVITKLGLVLSDTCFPQAGFDYDINGDGSRLKIIGVDLL